MDPRESALRGASDEALLTRAIEEARVLVTRDIGLGGLALRRLEQGVSLGVVLVRLPAEMASGDAAAMVDAALLLADLPNDGLGVFAVISLNKVRVRIVVRRAPTEQRPVNAFRPGDTGGPTAGYGHPRCWLPEGSPGFTTAGAKGDALGVVRVDLPQELIALLGESPERVADEARKALVLYLLRMGKLSQGKAGEFLGLDRWGVLDLMAEHHIESGPATIEELEREVEQVDRFVRESGQ